MREIIFSYPDGDVSVTIEGPESGLIRVERELRNISESLISSREEFDKFVDLLKSM